MTILKSSQIERWLTVCAILTTISAAVAALVGSAEQAHSEYQVGDELPAIAEFKASESPATLIVVAASSCSACRRSAEAIRRIAATPSRRFRVVLLSFERKELFTHFVVDANIRADQVLSLAPGSLRFWTVPRIALIDQTGVIRGLWVGSDQITTSINSIIASADSMIVEGNR